MPLLLLFPRQVRKSRPLWTTGRDCVHGGASTCARWSPVRNLTSNGALIESKRPLAVESLQSVCLMIDGQAAVAEAHVRHMRPDASGNFFVGVEFHSAPSVFQEALDRLLAVRSFPAEVA